MMLPFFVQNAISRLEANGFEAFAVGGAVRDFLLGRTPYDWDIATSALPTDVIRIFGKKHCIPTGIKHGTVTLIKQQQPLEVTTYRIDGDYRDNRHPETVTFSTNIIDDLSRRDFTINAIAYNPRVGFVDPFGGHSDLKLKVVRAVGEPCKRFEEDALRIMRGLRFAAVLNFKIDSLTNAAMHQSKQLLCKIAKERLQSELSKLLISDNPQKILTEFADVFAIILNIDFCNDTWLQNANRLSSCPPDLCIRLAVLLDGIAANLHSYEILRWLKYDSKTVLTVKAISYYLDADIPPKSVAIKHILSRLGGDNLRLVLAAKRAKHPDDIASINKAEGVLNEIISSNQCYLQKDLAVSGYDLLELGITGAAIGRILKLLLNHVIEEKCENERSALLELANKMK